MLLNRFVKVIITYTKNGSLHLHPHVRSSVIGHRSSVSVVMFAMSFIVIVPGYILHFQI